MIQIGPSAREETIGIVEKTDTATHAITAGQYVVWKGVGCVASSNISVGDTLSSSNLTAVSNGVANDIKSKIPPVSDSLSDTSTTNALSAAKGKALNDSIGALTVSTDANTVSTGKTERFQYDSNTLNTPYKEGSTSFTSGWIESFASSNNYAIQLCTLCGDGEFIRTKKSGTWGSWRKIVTGWTLFDTVTISANGDASRGITVPTDANEWAIRIEEAAMLLPIANVSVMASGWISIGTYGTATVTGNHSGQNISIAFRKTSDGSAIFGGRNMYVYYR